MFWDNLIDLCNKNCTTPTALVGVLGISVGSITKWKNGAVPRDTTLKKIADYFCVPVEKLTADQTIHVAEYSHIDYQLNDFSLRLFGVADKLTTTEQKLLALYNKIEDKEGLLRFIERLAALSEEQQKFVFDNLLQGQ